ncbi:MAG: hypothetical protein GX442_26485 [Candidatus Riflebacteria bacterium]|nr:hypothetical protein [Candidatus Riflebacteria bacterium]
MNSGPADMSEEIFQVLWESLGCVLALRSRELSRGRGDLRLLEVADRIRSHLGRWYPGRHLEPVWTIPETFFLEEVRAFIVHHMRAIAQAKIDPWLQYHLIREYCRMLESTW